MQKSLDSNRLVFLDESGVNINMTRIYGRAKGKQRARDYINLRKGRKTTILSSVRLNGKTVYKYFQGSLNGNIFLEYIKDALVPTLNKGDIVIADNLSSHKVSGVKEAIKGKGAFLLYLPPYSPDLNPIEMMWSKIKSLLRKWKARSIEWLNKAINNAFRTVSVNDISGWFSEAGYSASKLETL